MHNIRKQSNTNLSDPCQFLAEVRQHRIEPGLAIVVKLSLLGSGKCGMTAIIGKYAILNLYALHHKHVFYMSTTCCTMKLVLAE